jgi:excisionase family DNA binding protein
LENYGSTGRLDEEAVDAFRVNTDGCACSMLIWVADFQISRLGFVVGTGDDAQADFRSQDGGPPKNGHPVDGESNLEPLWDAGDVARYLKSSRSWVYHAAERGELPCLRIGGLLRFEPHAVRGFARGEKPPTGHVVTLVRR